MPQPSIDPSFDRLLRVIAEATAAVTGDDFMRSLVRGLAEALDVRYAFVAEFTDVQTRVRTLAFWDGAGFLDDFEYDLAGTPCEAVLAGEMRLYRHDVQALFPDHQEELAELGADSYLAIPLKDRTGKVMGHLALIDVKPMLGAASDLAVLQIFAARAGAELERMRAEEQRRQSEERLAAVLGSAMDAIVTLDHNCRVVLFNPAAERIFGCGQDLVLGQTFDRFIADRLRRLLEDAARITGDRPADPIWAPPGLTAIRHNGQEFPIEATLSPLILGGRRHLTLILRDTGERDQALAELERLKLENRYFREQADSFEDIVGRAPAMRRLFTELEQVAQSDVTVLVIGETGTGKEGIAHALHRLSPRREGMLVKLNCAALPGELIESELFGHEKGAFTGATAQRKGRFELADGGTLFLDEVGELTLPAQAKLLRVLQEQAFERVGGSRTLQVNVRVIAATNRNLAESVKAGEFRADLFYRLNVFPIQVPPLRERREDIPLLAAHFLERFARKLGKPLNSISPESIQRMENYAWPGNVRELQNVIERAAVLAREPMVRIDLPADSGPAALDPEGDMTLEAVERVHLLRILEETRWVIEGKTGAASLLKLTPSTLRYRMQKLGIRRPR